MQGTRFLARQQTDSTPHKTKAPWETAALKVASRKFRYDRSYLTDPDTYQTSLRRRARTLASLY